MRVVVTGATGNVGTSVLTGLDQAPEGYDIFQKTLDGCIKVVLRP